VATLEPGKLAATCAGVERTAEVVVVVQRVVRAPASSGLLTMAILMGRGVAENWVSNDETTGGTVSVGAVAANGTTTVVARVCSSRPGRTGCLRHRICASSEPIHCAVRCSGYGPDRRQQKGNAKGYLTAGISGRARTAVLPEPHSGQWSSHSVMNAVARQSRQRSAYCCRSSALQPGQRPQA